MARPREKGLKYFPHDCNLDEKIEIMVSMHGNDGYAFYFRLLERIYQTDDAELDISHPAIRKNLRMRLGVTVDKFEKMLNTSVDPTINLFDFDRFKTSQVLTSDGVKKRAGVVLRHREGNRSKVLAAVSAAETPTGTPQEPGRKQRSNLAKTPERKEKKRKEEKRGTASPQDIAMRKAETAWDNFLEMYQNATPDSGISIPHKTTREVFWEVLGKHAGFAELKARIDQNGGALEHEFKERYMRRDLADFQMRER